LDTLQAALDHYGVKLPSDQVQQLDAYCHKLWEWNRQLNLTRHDTYDKFVARDVTDAIQLAQLLQGDEEVLDVGTGGGLPGVPLGIIRPDIQVSLCESVAKKAKAIDDMVRRLGLPIPVYHDRAETVLEDLRFSSLVVRGVGRIAKLLKWFHPHWAAIGRLLLVKGPNWTSERGEARHLGLFADLELRKRQAYTIPGTDIESVILEICPKRQGGVS